METDLNKIYKSIIETLEILEDPDLMRDLRQSMQEVREEKGIRWERAKESLGLIKKKKGA